jgi:hypothetical protein
VTVLTAFVMKNIPNPWVPRLKVPQRRPPLQKKNPENNFHPFGFQKIPPVSDTEGGI